MELPVPAESVAEHRLPWHQHARLVCLVIVAFDSDLIARNKSARVQCTLPCTLACSDQGLDVMHTLGAEAPAALVRSAGSLGSVFGPGSAYD